MLPPRPFVAATKQPEDDEKTRVVTTGNAQASWLTPPQAARTLGVSLKRVRELIKGGRVEMRPRSFNPVRQPKVELRRESLEAALRGKTIPPPYSAVLAPAPSPLDANLRFNSDSQPEPDGTLPSTRAALENALALPAMTSDLFLEAAAVVAQRMLGTEGRSAAITEILRRALAQAATVA